MRKGIRRQEHGGEKKRTEGLGMDGKRVFKTRCMHKTERQLIRRGHEHEEGMVLHQQMKGEGDQSSTSGEKPFDE